ncbi:cell division protein FtsL [Pararhizobium haloflavum]|uniref:cell division protein FtsL n=1 Tax=Pararhizobium haloflavum TaxID=2037914 RepID=UPI000C17B4CD|nr:hypothetical protein [Pararhizobium haloflavum]
MLRTFDMLLIALMIAAATITYQIKHHAEEKLAHVRDLQAKIRLEEQTIDLLKADWALLNQPARLQRLTERFEETLELGTIDPEQIATLDELPSKLLQIEELIAQPLEGFTDPTITGSVVR